MSTGCYASPARAERLAERRDRKWMARGASPGRRDSPCAAICLVAGRVADDVVAAVGEVAGGVGPPARAGAGRDVRSAVVSGVEGATAHDHERVTRVGVDGDPLARAGLAVGLEVGRILGA